MYHRVIPIANYILNQGRHSKSRQICIQLCYLEQLRTIVFIFAFGLLVVAHGWQGIRLERKPWFDWLQLEIWNASFNLWSHSYSSRPLDYSTISYTKHSIYWQILKQQFLKSNKKKKKSLKMFPFSFLVTTFK